MPQVFKIGSYLVYFWMDEGKPLEPVHVHVSKGVPSPHATKIWITQAGKAMVAYRSPDMSRSDLRKVVWMIEANVDTVREKWLEYFDELRYYC
jgi:hypothetical protein